MLTSIPKEYGYSFALLISGMLLNWFLVGPVLYQFSEIVAATSDEQTAEEIAQLVKRPIIVRGRSIQELQDAVDN